LTSALLIAATTGAMAQLEDHGMMKVDISQTNTEVTIASTSVDTSMFGWIKPFTWWPSQFCLWDYWTTGAWQVTLSGQPGVQCNDAAGRRLATYARQTMLTNRLTRGWLFGNVGAVTTSSVLCAKLSSTQLTYTIRLVAPRNAMSALRQPSSMGTMNGLFTRTTVSRTLSGMYFDVCC
jgi:hypothetical protein